MRETSDGHHAILGWQGEPEITARCDELGGLRLQSITMHAFQVLDLPRQWDDRGRPADAEPHEELAALFRRVKAALYAWGEVMDHLT